MPAILSLLSEAQPVFLYCSRVCELYLGAVNPALYEPIPSNTDKQVPYQLALGTL